MWDVDGNRYVDLCGAFGPLILGHAPPAVRQSLLGRLADGWIFGAASELEVRLAAEVRRRMPHAEMLRFCASGTEATMHAVRLARAATGREVVVKMDGGFHGSHDAVLVKAGSGVATHALPDSAGVPAAVAGLTRVAPFNDLAAVEAALAPGDVAAVLVEPALLNVGVVAPQPGYLKGLRKITRAYGALLVFDEVVTGFRVAPGGASELWGVAPDLTTLGKVLGGGLPLAAFAGRRDLLARVAPSGPVYQAGTYAGSPLAVAAGLATLAELTAGAYRRLDESGGRLAEGLAAALARRGRLGAVPRVASALSLFFLPSAPRSWAEAKLADREGFWALFHRLLDAGVYLPPSPFEAWFLSTAHDDATIDTVVAAADRALA